MTDPKSEAEDKIGILKVVPTTTSGSTAPRLNLELASLRTESLRLAQENETQAANNAALLAERSYLRKENEDLKRLLGAERDKFGALELELMRKLTLAREALENIRDAKCECHDMSYCCCDGIKRATAEEALQFLSPKGEEGPK